MCDNEITVKLKAVHMFIYLFLLFLRMVMNIHAFDTTVTHTLIMYLTL